MNNSADNDNLITYQVTGVQNFQPISFSVWSFSSAASHCCIFVVERCHTVLHNRRLSISRVRLSFKNPRFYANASSISPSVWSDFSQRLAETDQDTHQDSTVFHQDVSSHSCLSGKVSEFLNVLSTFKHFTNHPPAIKPPFIYRSRATSGVCKLG